MGPNITAMQNFYDSFTKLPSDKLSLAKIDSLLQKNNKPSLQAYKTAAMLLQLLTGLQWELVANFEQKELVLLKCPRLFDYQLNSRKVDVTHTTYQIAAFTSPNCKKITLQ